MGDMEDRASIARSRSSYLDAVSLGMLNGINHQNVKVPNVRCKWIIIPHLYPYEISTLREL